MAKFLILSIVFSYSVVAFAQSPQARQKSPKEVVQQFWAMETRGGTLWAEDWYKASAFFVRPDPFPLNNVIHVVWKGRTDKVEEAARTENWAEVYVTTYEVGQLDPDLRFKRSLGHTPDGEPLLGPLIKFHLVLSRQRWELKPDGALGRELTGPPEWLIDCPESGLWIDVDAAMGYVTKMRDNTADPAMKKKADETLAKLKKLH